MPRVCFSAAQRLGGRAATGASYLAVMKAQDGDYAVDACSQLCLPGSAAAAAACGLTSNINAMRWSPHRGASTVAVASDSGVLGIDLRCMQ